MLNLTRARAGTRLAYLLIVTAAVALPATISADPASADGVRDAQQWVLTAVQAPAAWPVTEGQGVTVAVIDSGVNPAVSDLTGSVTSGPDLTGVGTSPADPEWGMHGTWMASLIAGHGDQGGGSGIIGVAPRARVLSIRVITDRQDPGYARYQRERQTRVQRELARAISYAVSHRAGVISMSLGYGRPSRAVRQALQDAFNHGVVVVASSGNSGGSAAPSRYSFPADYPGVLGVAAISQDGTSAGFSTANLSVQVAAPGVQVPAQGKDGRYWLVSGTSPACALTAGVVALIRSKYPALAPPLVRQALTTTASHRPPAGGYDDRVGFGTVDAAAALAAAGRLAATSGTTGLKPAKRGVRPGRHFGGGRRAALPAPVPARGLRELVLFCVLGLACLAVIVTATSRLVLMRRQPPGELYLQDWAAGYGPDQAVGQPDRHDDRAVSLPPDGGQDAGLAPEDAGPLPEDAGLPPGDARPAGPPKLPWSAGSAGRHVGSQPRPGVAWPPE
jgi:subtilisin family serine protease